MLKPATLKIGLFVLFVMTLVCLPFAIWGEEFVLPLLESKQEQTVALVLIAIALLACDSVAPIPATLVIMFLAARTGRVSGILGGTIGLSVGVLIAAWLGRTAVGRLAPKFMSDADLVRLRTSLQSRLAITLACLRSVPVLAETSVIVAAATGIPVKRIFLATLLPNFIVATIYSLSASESPTTAAVTFLATMLASWVLWRLMGKGSPELPTQK